MNKQARAVRDAAGLTYQQALSVVLGEAGLVLYDDTQCQVMHMTRPVFAASDTRLVLPGEAQLGKPAYDCQCDACEAARR